MPQIIPQIIYFSDYLNRVSKPIWNSLNLMNTHIVNLFIEIHIKSGETILKSAKLNFQKILVISKMFNYKSPEWKLLNKPNNIFSNELKLRAITV